MNAKKYFITHSFRDLDLARHLDADLREQGFEGFLDAYSITPGQSIPAKINHALLACDIYIPILSFATLRSKWCREEIDAAIALTNDPKRKGRPLIIPFLIEECQGKLPIFLRSRLYVNATTGYADAFKLLLTRGFSVENIDLKRKKTSPVDKSKYKNTIRVLVADDHEFALLGLDQIVRKARDMKIIGRVDSPSKVLNAVKYHKPDVIVLDLKWGEDSHVGLSLCKQISEKFPKTKIVAISVYSALLESAYLGGAARILDKGFTNAELLEAIRWCASSTSLE